MLYVGDTEAMNIVEAVRSAMDIAMKKDPTACKWMYKIIGKVILWKDY